MSDTRQRRTKIVQCNVCRKVLARLDLPAGPVTPESAAWLAGEITKVGDAHVCPLRHRSQRAAALN